MARRTPTTIISRDPQLRARLLHTLRRNPDIHVVDPDATPSADERGTAAGWAGADADPGIPATAGTGSTAGSTGPAGRIAVPAPGGSASAEQDDEGLAGAHVAVIAVDSIDADAMRLIRLHRRQKGRRVVVAAGQLDQESVCDALDAGATSFVRLAPASAAELGRMIGNAARGEDSVPPEMIPGVLHGLNRLDRQRTGDANGPAMLTDRELTVLRLLAEGWAVAEISREMSYSERTIKNIVHEITMRLGLRNRTQAVAFAVRSGLI